MNILLDPNVSYFLLVCGAVLAILTLLSPGTGFFEISAMVLLVLAGYGIVNHPLNYWALAILLLGVFPFLLALRRSRQQIYLLPALLSLIIGSVFLFRAEEGFTAVNPYFATLMSALAVGLLWVIGRKAIEAIGAPVTHDPNRLIGSIGEARTNIYRDGTVYVGGEEWTARSESFIPAGSLVHIAGREGLVLLVEAVNKAPSQPPE